MKLLKLTAANLAGGDLVKQIENALERVRVNIAKYGNEAGHSIQINIPFSKNIENDYWQNSVQTTVTCKLKDTQTGASSPIKIDAKGLYDANSQLELPIK